MASNESAAIRARLVAQYGMGTVAGFKSVQVNGLTCLSIRFTDGTTLLVREVAKGEYRTVKEEELPPLEPPREDRCYGDGDRD